MQLKIFLKATAICSFLGALTTGLLIFLPNLEAVDFEARALLSGNQKWENGSAWPCFSLGA